MKDRNVKGLLGYAILTLAAIAAFAVAAHDRQIAREQTCRSTLDVKRTLADVVDVSFAQSAISAPVDPSLPESIRKLIEDSRVSTKASLEKIATLMEKPLPICQRVGIDSIVHLKVLETVEVVPSGPTITTTTSTTQTTSRSALRGRTTVIRGSPGPAGPPGPSGASPGTTAPPASTSTTKPPGEPGTLCKILGIGC